MLAQMSKTDNCAFTAASGIRALDFDLPPELEAGQPPELRGLARDEVKLMVSGVGDGRIHHAQFHDLPRFLQSGDVLVINTSGTLPAALPAARLDGTPLDLHLSTRLPADLWSVELRQPQKKGTAPFYTAVSGETLTLPGGGKVRLHTPYAASQRQNDKAKVRLWIASLDLPLPVGDYLAEHGFPIRYGYVDGRYPLSFYQTVYATEMGSAEMPSAGRAFTPELITRLAAKGVQIAPLILHTGVASLEDHEPPYEEFYRIPETTAQIINQAKANGRRVIAVGTTVIRALETVAGGDGRVHPGSGWTGLIITPQRGIHVADGLLTGLHEPRATHLAMLEALAGADHLCQTYQQALDQQYLWHEFGDLHLILP